MGADGHTAGIFPYPDSEEKFKELFEGENWVVGYDAAGKHQYNLRATVTNTFLRNKVEAAVAFVTGEEKKEKFEQMQVEGNIAEIPAIIWNQMKIVKVFSYVK